MLNSVSLIIFVLITIFLSAAVQGVTGFGFSLFALPLLTLVLPIRQVTPLLILYSLITNASVLYSARKHINLRKIIVLLIFGLIATPLGAYMLLAVNARVLRLITGIILVITSLVMLKGIQIKIKNEKAAYAVVGTISGLLNGSVSLSGPPVVLFLSNQGAGKEVFRAQLSVYFFILNIFTVFSFMLFGIFDKAVFNYSLIFIPALFLGVAVGILFAKKVNESLFRKICLGVINIMGIITVFSCIFMK